MTQQGKFQLPARAEYSSVEMLASSVAGAFEQVASAMEQTMNASAASTVRMAAQNLGNLSRMIYERQELDLAARKGPVRNMLSNLVRVGAAAELNLDRNVFGIIQKLSIPDYQTTQHNIAEVLHQFYLNEKAAGPGINLIVSHPPAELKQVYVFNYPTVITEGVKIEATEHYHKFEINQTYRNGAHVKIFFDVGVQSGWVNGIEVYVVRDPLEGQAYKANLSFIDCKTLKDQLYDAMSRIGYDDAKRSQLDLYEYHVFQEDLTPFIESVKVDLPKFIDATIRRSSWVRDAWLYPNLDIYWGVGDDADKLFWKLSFATSDGNNQSGNTVRIAGIDNEILRLEEGNHHLVFDEGDQQLFKATESHYNRDRKVKFDPSTWMRCMDQFRKAYMTWVSDFKYQVTNGDSYDLWRKRFPDVEPTDDALVAYKQSENP